MVENFLRKLFGDYFVDKAKDKGEIGYLGLSPGIRARIESGDPDLVSEGFGLLLEVQEQGFFQLDQAGFEYLRDVSSFHIEHGPSAESQLWFSQQESDDSV